MKKITFLFLIACSSAPVTKAHRVAAKRAAATATPSLRHRAAVAPAAVAQSGGTSTGGASLTANNFLAALSTRLCSDVAPNCCASAGFTFNATACGSNLAAKFLGERNAKHIFRRRSTSLSRRTQHHSLHCPHFGRRLRAPVDLHRLGCASWRFHADTDCAPQPNASVFLFQLLHHAKCCHH